jgi:hypothetical protein
MAEAREILPVFAAAKQSYLRRDMDALGRHGRIGHVGMPRNAWAKRALLLAVLNLAAPQNAHARTKDIYTQTAGSNDMAARLATRHDAEEAAKGALDRMGEDTSISGRAAELVQPPADAGQAQAVAEQAVGLFKRFVRAEEAERSDLLVKILEIFNGWAEPADPNTGRRLINEQFLAAFENGLPQSYWALVDAYKRDLQGERELDELPAMAYDDITNMLERMDIIARDLRTPGYDIGRLSARFGDNLVNLVYSFIQEEMAPRIATLEDMKEKIDAIKEFAEENGIAEAKILIDGENLAHWESEMERLRGLGEEASQDDINSLFRKLPRVSDLEYERRQAEKIAERFGALMDGSVAYYYSIGDGWISRAMSLLAQIDDRKADGGAGWCFKAVLDSRLGERDTNIETLRTTVDQVRHALLVIGRARVALNGNLDEDQKANIDSMLDQIPTDVMSEEDVEELKDDFEAMMRRAGEATAYTPQSLESAVDLIEDAVSAVPRELRERILLGTVSMWHYEIGGTEIDASGIDALRAAYRVIGRELGPAGDFTRFDTKIQQLLESTAEAAPLSTGEEDIYDGAVVRDTKMRLEAAAEVFNNLPIEARFALYQLVKSERGVDSLATLTSEDAEKIAGIINGLEGMPSAYAALLIRKAGPTLFENYDGGSIEVIVSAISGYSSALINGGFYRELGEYYEGLPERIREIFIDVYALRDMAREENGRRRDVRVRLPSDRPDFAEIYVPAANIVINVPRHVYVQWVASGAIEEHVAPDVTQGPAAPPSLRETERGLWEDAVWGRVNVPLPYISLPLVFENLWKLAPEFVPPVGDMNAFDLNASGAYHSYRTPAGETSTFAVREAGRIAGEGGREFYESYEIASVGTGGEKRHIGQMRLRNQPMGPLEMSTGELLQGDFDVEVTGSTLDRLLVSLNTTAPAGADSAAYFLKQGDEYKMYVFKRWENGSFGLVDARTLGMDEMKLLYDTTFATDDAWKLYASTRFGGEDWSVQMDGAVLFAGVPAEDVEFQGIGAATQEGEFGGYVDYEHTRGGRVGAGFGQMDMDERTFWVGRLYVSDIEESAEHPAAGIHGEFEYFVAGKGMIDGFIGIRRGWEAENLEGGVIGTLLRDGWYIGGGGGYMMHESINPTEDGTIEGAVRLREQRAGGRVYAGTRDLAKAAVASVMMGRTIERMETAEPEIAPVSPLLAPADVSPLSRPEQSAAAAEQADAEWKLRVAGAARWYVSSIGLRMTGGGMYDEDSWKGGFGFASLLQPTSWMPEIGGFAIYLKRDSEGNIDAIPIYGATAEILPAEGWRFRGQGFAVGESGGGGDLHAYIGRGTGVDLVVTGVDSEELGAGIFAAVRARFMEDRLRFIGGGGYSEQTVEGEERQATEWVAIGALDLAESGEDLTLTSVYAGATGISMDVVPVEGGEARSATQVDAQLGLAIVNSDYGIDARAGVQYWEAGERERVLGIFAIDFKSWRGFWVFDSFSAGANMGIGVQTEGENETINVQGGANVRGTF